MHSPEALYTMLRIILMQTFRRPLTSNLLKSSLGVKSGPKWSPKLIAGYRNQVYYRDGPRYERFQAKENIFLRWARRPTFYYEVGFIGGAGGLCYIYNLEQVPVNLNLCVPRMEVFNS